MTKPIALGKAFRFYMQYPEEVDYFCYEDEPDMTWLERKERKEFEALCEKLNEEADEDFQRIAREMGARLRQQLRLKNIGTSKVKIATSYWEWRLFLQMGRKKKVTYMAGVFVTTVDGRAIAFPWVWVKGGRKQEPHLRQILKLSQETFGGAEFSAGSVPLDGIVLEASESDEAIVDKILKPFSKIGKAQWRKIASLG